MNIFKFKPKSLIGTEFSYGQKVFFCITHEVRESFIGNGEIIACPFKKKSYWAFSDIPSNWFTIKATNGKILTLPKERIYDLKERIETMEKFYKANENRIGEKGYSFESAYFLLNNLNEMKEYNNQ